MWSEPAFRLFFALALLIAAAVLALGGWSLWERQHLWRHGVQVAGEVSGHEVRAALRGGDNHYFSYRYRAPDGRLLEAQLVAGRQQQDWKVGQAIVLTCDPQDPQRHLPQALEPADIFQPLLQALLFAISLPLTVLAFAALVFHLRRRDAARQL